MTYDLIVIGAGIAGLTAANEAAKCGLQVCLLERLMFGGLVLNVNHLDPKPPGLPGSGSDAASELMMTASDLGTPTAIKLFAIKSFASLTDKKYSLIDLIIRCAFKFHAVCIPILWMIGNGNFKQLISAIVVTTNYDQTGISRLNFYVLCDYRYCF